MTDCDWSKIAKYYSRFIAIETSQTNITYFYHKVTIKSVQMGKGLKKKKQNKNSHIAFGKVAHKYAKVGPNTLNRTPSFGLIFQESTGGGVVRACHFRKALIAVGCALQCTFPISALQTTNWAFKPLSPSVLSLFPCNQ